MKNIKTIIIEDEGLASQLLSNQLKEFNFIEQLGIFENGFSGLKAIQELQPDLVFLDIELPKLTGLELLELLDNPPMIIFTTAYNQYAITAFERNAIDYLLKPYSKKRLLEAIEKAQKHLLTLNENDYGQLITNIQEEKPDFLDRIAVKNKNNIHLIAINDIYYLEAQGDYVAIHTKEEKYLKNISLKFYVQNLDPKTFLRVHRSFIVNTKYINKLENYNKDSYMLILHNHKSINISRSGLQLLKEMLYL